MKAKLELANVKDLEATMTITMRISDWMELKEQLGGNWPSWKFGSCIRELIEKATKEFYSTSRFL